MQRWLVLTCVLLIGCFKTPSYQCADDTACGTDGSCEPNGFCSFLDSSCSSGRRYSELAGDGFDNICVGETPPGTPDAGMPDTATGCSTWTPAPQHFDPCALPTPAPSVTLSPGEWVFDTDSGGFTGPTSEVQVISIVVTQADDSEVRVIASNSFTVIEGATFRAVGSRPVIIASLSNIVINGRIDVGASLGIPNPAGHNPQSCGNSTALDGVAGGSSGGGGGGGGAFGANGGDGGRGGGDPYFDGGVAGVALGAVPTVVRGGCAGGQGGDGSEFGNGGGAVHLSAQTEIIVTGTINAGGQGGGAGIATPSAPNQGGGGAGSGGYVGLEAPSVSIAIGATLSANGGGGGSGSDFGDDSGVRGSDAVDETVATGGPGVSEGGGQGGVGGALASPSGQSGFNKDLGGGGGGGGVGWILFRASEVANNGTSSPAPINP